MWKSYTDYSHAKMSSLNTPKPSVIPDQVLETHTCRRCHKYLTVSPITVHPDGGNICGRCHHKVNKSYSLFVCDSVAELIEQVNIPYAIFGYVNHLFPCVNRYEGCDKLLAFGDIGNHEVTCKPKKIKCRFCDYEGTGSQQINHFKSVHPLNFLDKMYFRFPLKHSCTYLVKRNEDLFFLDMEFDKCKKLIKFYVKPTKRLEDDIDFFCLLKEVGGEVTDQSILQKRGDGIYHCIYIKDECFSEEDITGYYCDCLLRKVSVNSASTTFK